jgi:hypothetical protein
MGKRLFQFALKTIFNNSLTGKWFSIFIALLMRNCSSLMNGNSIINKAMKTQIEANPLMIGIQLFGDSSSK